ncbi:squalene/phytoene synthase family protein [Streptomyces sp. NPDC048506]|uniref:phytoene/squalene synthase family protein n=1 Tax=Streptomyces sp. NPDC048506 TaxID=3155028 RepID=UPI00342ECF6A
MLVRRWLDEAGIYDPALRRCYVECIRDAADQDGGNARWWGLRSVPAALRPHVGAVISMGFAVDRCADTGPADQRRRRFDEYADAVLSALATGRAADPVLHAVAHTFRTFGLPVSLCEDFLAAGRQDLDFAEFATYEELRRWSTNSTGAPTVLMVGLLVGPDVAGRLEPELREFGELGQLMDVLCDLGEDLRDGRLYLPLEDLDRFGVRAEDVRARRWTSGMAGLVRFEAERITRRLPTLVAALQPGTSGCFLGVVEKYCALVLREVLADGAAVLHRSPRPPLTDALAVWQPHWRSTIPC